MKSCEKLYPGALTPSEQIDYHMEELAELKQFFAKEGYRPCDISSCNCENFHNAKLDALQKRLELAEVVCEEAWDCYVSGIWREFNLRLLDKWKAHKEKQ